MNKDNNEKLGRRRLVVKLGAVGAVTLGAAACVPVQPVYVRPSGTGLTDADPNDGPGNGRGGARGYHRGTGLTDADPNDGPGNGRGGARVYHRGTGTTDADPNDGPGRGRGGYRGGRGVTDSDPNDGPGRGRRGY